MVVGGWGAAARQDPDEGDGAGASDRVRDPVMWRCPRPTCNFGYNNRFVSACVECNEPRPAIADPRTAARRQGPEAQIVIRDDPVPAPPGAKGFEGRRQAVRRLSAIACPCWGPARFVREALPWT